jgi:hypothetical protein
VSLAKLMNTPATIIRRSESGEEDAYGNETEDSEEAEVRCSVQKQARADEEPGDAGEMSDTHYIGFFPIGTEIDINDGLRHPSIGVLEVVGTPWVAEEGSPAIWHVEVPLRRTAGPEGS